MNRKVLSALLLLAATLSGLFSCGKAPQGSDAISSYCRVKDSSGNTLTSIESTYEGLTAKINVESDLIWSVSASDDWMGVAPSLGNKYGSFTLTVFSNRTSESRTGTVTVSAKGVDPVLISVRQSGKEGAVDDNSLDIRFMSFNIRTGGKSDGSTDEPGHEWATVRKPAVFKMFGEIDPDIAVLQECRQEQLNDFEATLTGYSYFRYACDGVLKSGATESCTTNIFKNSGARNVIMVKKSAYDMVEWGRFWLSDTPSVVSTFPETESKKVTLWVKLRERATKKDIYVFNIHFITPGKGDCLLKCANCTVEQMKSILGDTALPVFLAGDFNAVDTDSRIAPVPAYMNNARFDAPVTDPSMTYNHFSTSNSDWKRLDHIFYLNAQPQRFKVVNETTYGTELISDHWPVFCDFKIK